MPPGSYFQTDDERWFVPTELARGPWDPHACHAGPPTGLLARGLERVVRGPLLARLTVDLLRPVPMDGVELRVEVERTGRTSGHARAELWTGSGKLAARGHGLFLAERALGEVPSAAVDAPRFELARPGTFPVRPHAHRETGFIDSIEVRYPPGEDGRPGPTTMWLKASPLLPHEAPSAVQSICPLADCGNAIGRNADLDAFTFVNPDLVLRLYRAPVGPWFASESISVWGENGIGLAESRLFDVEGLVGFASQTLVLGRASES